MSHDPLCGLSQPCDDEIREHGYCLMSHGKFCIHCNQWCICPQLQQAKEEVAQRIIEMANMQADVAAAMASDDMLAKCIAAVEGQRRFWRDADGTYLQGGEWNEALTTAAHVLRGLQAQP